MKIEQYYNKDGTLLEPFDQKLKKGDQAIHASRGKCVLLTDIAGGPNQGTLVELEGGEKLEASSIYLKPLPTPEK